MRTILSIVCFLALLSLAEAQISIVDSGAAGNQINLGAVYTQSFDSLANTNTAPVPWNNNSTLSGWYAYRNDIGDVFAYSPSQGGATSFGSFGILGDADRALGSALGISSSSFLHFGVQFVNNSSSIITAFDLSFDGEQWFKNFNFFGTPDSLTFSYRIFDAGGGSISASGEWTSVDGLTFTSPVNVGDGAIALNGNLSENRIADIHQSIDEFYLMPGQELWVRWTATNSPSADHALAIDNLSVRFHAIPEPAACAVLAGGLVLLSALRRRRR